MNDYSDSEKMFDLAIVGAGPAGLAAALEAQRLGWHVLLLDQSPQPGGKPLHYACKADDKCQLCGICQVYDAVTKVATEKNILILSNRIVTKCTPIPSSRNYLLNTQSTIPNGNSADFTSARVLLATGFDPFDLTNKPAFGMDRLKNVTSLENLEKHLRDHSNLSSFADLDPNNTSISIAFIQCVGSRDSSRNADYCSQVCCRTTIRIANLLKHMHPQIDSTVFYMDLQTPDACSRELVNGSAAFRLIRSLPSEVASDPDGKLRLRYEAEQSNEMMESHFDLLVLAGAIHPRQPIADISNLPNLRPDNIGFWQVFSSSSSSLSTLAIAGTATGPKDILSTMAHARSAIRKLSSSSQETL